MIHFLDLQRVNARYSNEIETAANEVIHSGRYLQGKATRGFEQEYAAYIGTDFAIGCANGLDALTLIYRAYIEMGLMKPGDEVILPANTFIASVLAVTDNNLVPVFCEPNPETLEIDEDHIESLITRRTRSLMIVHLYGRLAYSERIREICQRYDLHLVEDNAQAHGCLYRNRHTGSLGEAAGHSFYPGKNLGALGDGGCVTTNNEKLAETIRSLANYGSNQKYVFPYCGRNSRLDEIQAAILRVKLRHLDEDNDRRRKIAAYYYDNLAETPLCLPRHVADPENVYHLFPVFAVDLQARDQLQAALSQHGIETLIHYPIPPHRQECYAKRFAGLSLPITETLHKRELSLPISPAMTLEEASIVVKAIKTIY